MGQPGAGRGCQIASPLAVCSARAQHPRRLLLDCLLEDKLPGDIASAQEVEQSLAVAIACDFEGLIPTAAIRLAQVQLDDSLAVVLERGSAARDLQTASPGRRGGGELRRGYVATTMQREVRALVVGFYYRDTGRGTGLAKK